MMTQGASVGSCLIIITEKNWKPMKSFVPHFFQNQDILIVTRHLYLNSSSNTCSYKLPLPKKTKPRSVVSNINLNFSCNKGLC